METPIQGVGALELSPHHKWLLAGLLYGNLKEKDVHTHHSIDAKVHWYISEVITACNTKYDVYHLVPKPLHQYISNFVMNPQEATPTLAKELRDKHSEAIDLIHIALMEKILEE